MKKFKKKQYNQQKKANNLEKELREIHKNVEKDKDIFTNHIKSLETKIDNQVTEMNNLLKTIDDKNAQLQIKEAEQFEINEKIEEMKRKFKLKEKI